MNKLLALMLCSTMIFAQRVYFYPFDSVEQTYFIQDMENVSEHQVNQLIKYNMGLIEHPVTTQISDFQALIRSFGKGNVMKPTDMTYLMLIQSDKLIEMPESQQARLTEGYAGSLNIVERSQKSIMDQLFADNEFSMVNRAQRHYKSEETLPFLIYQNEDDLDINFLHWTVTLYLGQNKEVFLYQPKSDRSFKVESSLEKCVDTFFGTSFDYSPSDNKIYKYNTNEMITITSDSEDLFVGFFKDICAMSKLSTTFKAGKTPNLLAIVNKSVAKLERVLQDSEITLVYDMMRIAHKKMSKNMKNFFNQDNLFGMIMVEEEKNPEVTTQREAAKVQRILMETKNRMLDQATDGSTTLSQVSEVPMTPETFQIYVWFGVFMVFVLYFTLYALFTMEIQKDTLLYAKFLTNDARN